MKVVWTDLMKAEWKAVSMVTTLDSSSEMKMGELLARKKVRWLVQTSVLLLVQMSPMVLL